MGLVDVAELEAWLDEMVAGVEVAVVLQRRSVAAGRRMDAQQVAAEEGLQRDVEELHEHLAHVVAHPFLEHVDEEAAVLFGADRALGDEVAGLRVEQALLPGCSLQPLLAIWIVCSVARSMIGMNCTHFAPSSSRKKR